MSPNTCHPCLRSIQETPPYSEKKKAGRLPLSDPPLTFLVTPNPTARRRDSELFFETLFLSECFKIFQILRSSGPSVRFGRGGIHSRRRYSARLRRLMR